MIDANGYRPNVGIILCNDAGRLFWARRVGMDSWQFPQGGVNPKEDPLKAMFRELREETGLLPEHVQVIGRTRYWLRYKLPQRFIRKNCSPVCIGQKQIWFILRFLANESNFQFNCTNQPEFDGWRWVEYWHPLQDVVYFKKQVYQRALTELGAMLVPESIPVSAKGYLKKPHKVNNQVNSNQDWMART